MDAIDSAILANCLDDCRPLKPLLQTIPKGTLYRHAKRLTQVGWLVREGRGYRTTEAGRRHMQAARQGRQWNQFDALYRVHHALADGGSSRRLRTELSRRRLSPVSDAGGPASVFRMRGRDPSMEIVPRDRALFMP